jgi:predicted ester cyclase
MNNKDFMNRWYTELWNNGNAGVIDEMLHPDVKAYGLGPEPLVGIDAFKEFYKSFSNDLTEIKVTVDNNIAEDNFVVSLCVVEAVHKKSRAPVRFTGTSIAQFEDGRLLIGWNHFDFLTYYLQIGKITQEQLA